MRVGIAGAGFSGAVVARELAEAGHVVTVLDPRDHVAGNCHTERDEWSGVMIHRYGPHIFHTDDERVWAYICRFGDMVPYNHRVKTTVKGRVYSLPVNLMTINQLFETDLDPAGAKALIAQKADRDIGEPANFEEQALKFVGRELYEAFFEGYTRKQWGLDPTQLPASILKRLPVRFNYDDSYFNHPHQAMPRNGYTEIVERILDVAGVEVRLSTPMDPAVARAEFDHIVWTGPLDAFYGHRLGRLGYRTVDFERIEAEGDLLGCAVMNYGDIDVTHTRIAEHKHFAEWEAHDRTVGFREYSRACGPDDTPYYPIRLVDDKDLLQQYLDLAQAERGVTFVGRLGTYRYLDMDVTIGEALAAADGMLAAAATGSAIPPFFVDPA